jgi:hypothetical protein
MEELCRNYKRAEKAVENILVKAEIQNGKGCSEGSEVFLKEADMGDALVQAILNSVLDSSSKANLMVRHATWGQ